MYSDFELLAGFLIVLGIIFFIFKSDIERFLNNVFIRINHFYQVNIRSLLSVNQY